MRAIALMAIIFLSLVSPKESFGALTFQIQTFYNSDTDDADNFEYTNMTNSFFLGATVNTKKTFFLGWAATLLNRTYNTGSSETEVATTEIGPEVLFYTSEAKSVFISLNWNPFVSGDKTSSSSTLEISGSSYNVALGYQLKVSKTFRLGASLNYHAMSITKTTNSSNVSTEVSQSYTSIVPMLEFAFHFK